MNCDADRHFGGVCLKIKKVQRHSRILKVTVLVATSKVLHMIQLCDSGERKVAVQVEDVIIFGNGMPVHSIFWPG